MPSTERALDRQSAVTVSIKVYYTPEFEQEFANPLGVIESHIASTNDAFIQSGVGHVQLQLLCTEKIDVMDAKTDDAWTRLEQFTNFKGGVGYILNSADIAVLMTAHGVGTLICSYCWKENVITLNLSALPDQLRGHCSCCRPRILRTA